MNCETAQETVLDAERGAAVVESELTAARAHVEACGTCRAAVADLRRIRTALQRFDRAAEPRGGWDEFTQRLVSSIARPPVEEESEHCAVVARRWAGDAALVKSAGDNGRRRGWVSWRFLAAAAACVITGVLGYGVGRHGAGTTRPPFDSPVLHAVGATLPAALLRAGFSAEQAREAVNVFTVLWKDQTAGNRTSWAVVDGNATGMDFERIEGDGATVAESPAPVGRVWLLRLTAVRDTEVFAFSVAMLPGRTADVTLSLGGNGDQKLRYLIATSADASPRATVWADLQNKDGRVIATAGRDVQLTTGEAISAGRLASPGGGYDLKVAFADAAFAADAGPGGSSTTPPVRGKGTL
jgi:hypothetical protein